MKQYAKVLDIDMAYVCGITDAGFTEYHDTDDFVEKDDLRLCIELSGGHVFMLTGRQRFYISEGRLYIEDLIEVSE